MFAQSPLHQSALYFKRNVLTGCYILTRYSHVRRSSAFALTGLSSAMPILSVGLIAWETRSNLSMFRPMNTRRGSDLDTYWFIRQWKDEYEFKAGEVCHIMNPDIHQEIYGMPEYMGRYCPPACHIPPISSANSITR